MPTRVTAFSDPFTRADAVDLGANWDAGYTVLAGAVSFTALRVASNQAENLTTSSDGIETVNAFTLPVGQWAQATLATIVATTAQSDVNLLVRFSTPGAVGGYSACVASNYNNVSGVFRTGIKEWGDSTGDPFIGTPSDVITWANGDVLSVEIIGTTITLYKNGVSQIVESAPSYTTQIRSGMTFHTSGGAAITDLVVDDFSCGYFQDDLSVSSVGEPRMSLSTF